MVLAVSALRLPLVSSRYTHSQSLRVVVLIWGVTVLIIRILLEPKFQLLILFLRGTEMRVACSLTSSSLLAVETCISPCIALIVLIFSARNFGDVTQKCNVEYCGPEKVSWARTLVWTWDVLWSRSANFKVLGTSASGTVWGEGASLLTQFAIDVRKRTRHTMNPFACNVIQRSGQCDLNMSETNWEVYMIHMAIVICKRFARDFKVISFVKFYSYMARFY